MTLVELLLASVLLAIAAVPILNAMGRSMDLAAEIQARTRAAFHAQRLIEDVLAAASVDFARDYTRSGVDLGDGYLGTVQQAPRGIYTKAILVSVGRDTDRDGVLDAGEVLVVLGTVVVNTGG
jgi:type II secretory pathway pseudopilin PulG